MGEKCKFCGNNSIDKIKNVKTEKKKKKKKKTINKSCNVQYKGLKHLQSIRRMTSLLGGGGK